MDKPIVKISLKRHLADFCRHEFVEYKDTIIINRHHIIGKRITSLISASTYPVRPPVFTNCVIFQLPVSPKSDLKGKFLFVDKEAERQINDFIETEFALECKLFFEKGYDLNFTQKEIIESFLQHYNIKHCAISYEAVKKNDYRKKRKKRKIIAEQILST